MSGGFHMNQKETIIFNSRDEILRLAIADIVYFEADGNYTDIVTVNKLRSTVRMNLAEMEKTIAEKLGNNRTLFMRIGKRFIINMNYIYQVNIAKQRIILSDYRTFAFQINLSKDALKKVKDIVVKINQQTT